MVESIMFFSLGFLSAGLLALMIVPLVHGRAVRLTRRRLEADAPPSLAEMQAHKDQLRAEFALSTRRLEMSVEQLKAKATGQLADIGKKAGAISDLKTELAEKATTIATLDNRIKTLSEKLEKTEANLLDKAKSHEDAERRLLEKEAQVGALGTDLSARSMTADSQRIEIVALKTQVGTLHDQLADLQQQHKGALELLSQERAALASATRDRDELHVKAEALTQRIVFVEQEAAARNAELESRTRRLTEIEPQADEMQRRNAEIEKATERLRAELAAAQRAESELRNELATLSHRYHSATEATRVEQVHTENQIAQLIKERDALSRELKGLRAQTERSFETERGENALLRERINDVAAEVAKLTATLEGAESPITALVSETPSASTPLVPSGGTSLADRIRALQDRSRQRSTN